MMLFASRICTKKLIAVCLGLVLAAAAVEGRAFASPKSGDAPASLPVAIETAVERERARQWIDAIDIYEKSVKKWPESAELKYGLRRSRIHFGIERRYDDGSFESRLSRLSRSSSLDLFDEVLEHIRLHYVDEVSATSFVAHGTESLYLALANDKFLERNLRGADRQRVAQLRRTLRDKFWNKPIADFSVARDTVSEVCDLAAAEIGIADTPIVLEYVFGGCNSLDDYSNFLTPDRLTDLHGNINGEFVGLGIEMKAERGKGMLLVNVLPDSPAAHGGLQPGEFITEIDGTNCTEMTTDEAAKLLRGQQGTRVALAIRAADERTRQGEFVRQPVEVKSIPVAKIIDQRRKIGYIRMTGFQSTSPRELDAALSKLAREGMRALVWDLRGNPGGLLPAATSVLDRFIDSGVLVSTRGRAMDQNSSYSASAHAAYRRLPLVLLVDGDSASASEIVAGAVHDHQRAKIVGRTTYGKWSVQTIYHMRDGAGLRLTTAKFYSPRGQNLSKVGVRPDEVVEAPEDNRMAYKNPQLMKNGKAGDDPDIERALEVLARQVQMTGR
jgi:carboxyl-terminal processing protease